MKSTCRVRLRAASPRIFRKEWRRVCDRQCPSNSVTQLLGTLLGGTTLLSAGTLVGQSRATARVSPTAGNPIEGQSDLRAKHHCYR